MSRETMETRFHIARRRGNTTHKPPPNRSVPDSDGESPERWSTNFQSGARSALDWKSKAVPDASGLVLSKRTADQDALATLIQIRGQRSSSPSYCAPSLFSVTSFHCSDRSRPVAAILWRENRSSSPPQTASHRG